MDNNTPSTCRAGARDTTAQPAAARSPTATRRGFLGNALLAAPLAVPASLALAHANPAVPPAGAGSAAGAQLQARLARLQDEAALRGLHQSWLRQLNAGEPAAWPTGLAHPSGARVRRINADPAGAADRFDVAQDGLTATGHFDCLVETEAPLSAAPAAIRTLADMAAAQGHGTVRLTQRHGLVVDFTRDRDAPAGEGWRITRAALSAGRTAG